MFCDVCGTKFADGYLRPHSKFCPMCGEELSKPVLNSLKRTAPETPQGTISAGREIPEADGLYKQTPAPSSALSSLKRKAETPQVMIRTAATRVEENLDDVDDALSGEQSQTPSRRWIQTRSRPTDNRPRTQEPEGSDSGSEYEGPPLRSPTRQRNFSERIRQVPIPEDIPEISLDIKSYGLGPPIQVHHTQKQGFSRKTISQVLGGSVQSTYCKSRLNGQQSMYVCYRLDYNYYLSPSKPGTHGIYFTGACPPELVLTLLLRF